MFSTPANPHGDQAQGKAMRASGTAMPASGMPTTGFVRMPAVGKRSAPASALNIPPKPVSGYVASPQVNEVTGSAAPSTINPKHPWPQNQTGDNMTIDGFNGNNNLMYGQNNAGGFGSMYGAGGIGATQRNGFMAAYPGIGMDGYGYIAGNGSMYGGMGGNPMGSMYGMGGNPMGSMYGMGGNPMGSMYGMGGNAMGSMYGMGGNPMGSMYGMGGNPMGSMYGGMGGRRGFSFMARSMSFSSYGGNSLYGSIGGSSLFDIGDRAHGISGMWGTDSSVYVRPRPDYSIPTVARVLREESEMHPSVTTSATQQEKEGEKPEQGRTAAAGTDDGVDAAEQGEKKAAGDGKSKDDEDEQKGAATHVDSEGKSRELNGSEVLLNNTASSPAAKDEGGAVDRHNIHGIIIIENTENTAVTATKAEAGQKVSLKTTSGKVAECRVDEVIKGSDTDISKSAVLHSLSTHMRRGYNTALIVIDKGENISAAVGTAIVSFYSDALGSLEADQKWEVDFAASAVSDTTKYRDLQDDSAEKVPPKNIVFGSNPLFGTSIMDLKTQSIKDAKEMANHVKSILAKTTQQKEIVFLHAVLRLRKDKELLMCSMNVYIVRDIEKAEAVAVLDDHRVPVPVLRSAIGGSTKTAAVVSLSGAAEAEAAETEAMRIMGSLCSKENLPPRSGNVARFIEYTNEQITKIDKDMENLSGAERERSAKMVEKLRKMKDDAMELMGSTEALPKMYPIHKSSTQGMSAANKENHTKEHSAASDRTKSSDATANGKLTPHSAAPVSPFSSIHRLVYLQDAKEASIGKAVQVVVQESMKAYDVDECIDSPATDEVHSVEQSNELSRMSSLLTAGYNVALLGMEFTAPTQADAQMTWRYVRHLLRSVLQSAAPEAAVEATLHMSVVHEDQVMADLGSSDSEPRRLVVLTSPLFGPVIEGITGVKVTQPEEVDAVMHKALANAQPVLKDGAMIVMTAVVQQIREDDVLVASMFAVSAADTRPFKSVLEQDISHFRTLFSYALGGPSSTGVLITASRQMDSSELARALTVQRSLAHIQVPSLRSGSVKEFVKHAQASLERQKQKMSAATESTEKEAITANMQHFSESLRDHEELLANPKTAKAKAYSFEAVSGGVLSVSKEHLVKVTTPLTSPRLGATPQGEEQQSNVKRVTPSAVTVSEPHDSTSKVLHAQEMVEPKSVNDSKPQDKVLKATQALVSAKEKPQEASEPTKAVQSEGKQAVQFLAIVNENNNTRLHTKEGWSVESSDGELIVTDVEGPHTFSVDEVVLREGRGSPIESRLLEELNHRFLQGNNVALLTADARGSSASLEMVDNTVRRVMHKIRPSQSLFMSLCALKVKENVILDTLTEGSDFKTIDMSTSPLLGPVVTGANFVKMSMVDQFSNLMNSSLRTCSESRACAVLQLVQVEIAEDRKDANVSSFLAIMCPGDTSVYNHTLKQSAKEGGILSLVLSGACFTVFAVGLTKQPVDESCLILSRLATSFKGLVPMIKLRSGSVRRFIEHTRDAVSHMQKKCEKSTTPEDKAKMQRYVDAFRVMVERSEAYLANPVGKIPPSFPLMR